MNNISLKLKRVLCLVLTLLMVITSVPKDLYASADLDVTYPEVASNSELEDNDEIDDNKEIKDISSLEISLENKTLTYTQERIHPIVIAKDGKYTLVENKDFIFDDDTLEIETGKYSATVKGINNYTGSITLDYEITKAIPVYNLDIIAKICEGWYAEYPEDYLKNNNFRFSEGQDKELVFGANEVYVDFVPEDTHNYEVVKNIPTVINILKHEKIFEYYVAPTCEYNGYNSYYCPNCTLSYPDDIEEPLGGEHEFEFDRVIEPYCCIGGYDVYKCKRCNFEEEKENGVAPNPDNHDWYVENYTESTCCSNGYMYRTCQLCYVSEGVDLPLKEHSYMAGEYKAANCCETGYINMVCSECLTGYSEELPIDENTHVWRLISTKNEATCQKEGEGIYSCSLCSATKEDIIPCARHKMEIDEAMSFAPTCQEEGLLVKKCTFEGCDYSTEESLPQDVHVYVRDEDASNDASHDNTLVDVLKCQYCGIEGPTNSYELQFDCEHGLFDENIVESVPSNCLTRGYNKFYCPECDDYYILYYDLSHNYILDIEVSSTYDEEGYFTFKCKSCGHKETAYIPTIDEAPEFNPGVHEHIYSSDTFPPVCGVEGFTHHYCTVQGCNRYYNDNFAEALPGEHDFVLDHIIPADCQNPGRDFVTCSKCGLETLFEREDEPINPNNHAWDYSPELHWCTWGNCEIIDQPHEFVDGVCRCGYEQTDNTIPESIRVEIIYPDDVVFTENGNILYTGVEIQRPSVRVYDGDKLLTPFVWNGDDTVIEDYYIDSDFWINEPGEYEFCVVIYDQYYYPVKITVEENPDIHNVVVFYRGVEPHDWYMSFDKLTYNYASGVTMQATNFGASGYTFLGWFEADENGNIVNNKALSKKDVFYYTIADADAYFVAQYVKDSEIYIDCNGSFTIDGINRNGSYYEYVAYASTLTLNCTADRFSHWADENGNIISTDREFTLVATHDMSIIAVFKAFEPDEISVEFRTAFQQRIANIAAKRGAIVDYTEPKIPNRIGYTALGWDYNGDGVITDADNLADAIKALEENNTILVILPVYEMNEETHKITVLDAAGETSLSVDVQTNEQYGVIAPEAPEGKQFSHWIDEEGYILCYSKNYRFYVYKDVVLTPVYVSVEEEYLPLALTYMEIVIADSAKAEVVFRSMSNVPEDCKIKFAGIIATTDSEIGNDNEAFDRLSALYVRGDSWNGSAYRFTWTKSKVESGTTWYARAYLEYYNESEELVTIYGDIVNVTMP